MTPSSAPAENVLALVAHKIAPFQFDISHSASSASIRDQIVRAQMVVRALLKSKLIGAGYGINSPSPLLICGAGVAGLAAAFEATRLGVRFVMIDKNVVAPGGALAGTGQRFASPTMYEWPASIVDEHVHPLTHIDFLASGSPKNKFKFGVGKPELIQNLRSQVDAIVSASVVRWKIAAAKRDRTSSWLLTSTRIDKPSKDALRALLSPGITVSGLPEISFTRHHRAWPGKYKFSCILFASGFSVESTTLVNHDVKTPQFWEPDTLLDAALGTTTKPMALVVGGGDGAIQDAMRALLQYKKAAHPLAVWEYLMRGPLPTNLAAVVMPVLGGGGGIDEAELYRRILTVENYSAIAYSWVPNNRIYKDIDVIYADLAKRLIVRYPNLVQRLAELLRIDVQGVCISTRGGFSRAYALNRFLIHLINEARACLVSSSFPTLEILKYEIEKFAPLGVAKTEGSVTFANGTTRYFDLIILRKGAKYPAYQAIGITGVDAARIELGRLPVPMMAPNE